MSLESASNFPDTFKNSSKTPKVLQPRREVRNGTFIIASTGEYARRQITLQDISRSEPFNLDGAPNTSSSTFYMPLHSQCEDLKLNTLRYTIEFLKVKSRLFKKWLKSPTAKAILKCSLAYLLGSLGTLSSPLAKILGHQDGKHIVATVMVYFHPARSAGSMAEAFVLGFAAITYATLIGFASMAVSVYFETQWNLVEVAYGVILFFFCGGGLGFVGWFKQAYSSPLVGVTCSLTSLTIISIITKEIAIQTGYFSYDKILQVLKMVTIGITMSAFLSFTLWPISARKELHETVITAADSAGDMLSLITTGFLTGSESKMQSTSLVDAQKKHKTSVARMTRCLREAKFEHYIMGTESLYIHQSNLVNCLERLHQSIGGLRSAAMTQFSLLKEQLKNGGSTPTNNSRYIPEVFDEPLLSVIFKQNEEAAIRRSIEKTGDEDNRVDEYQEYENTARLKFERTMSGFSRDSSLLLHTVRTPQEIFSRFIVLLGPSIKSLAYTLHQILQELPVKEEPENAIRMINQFKKSLEVALKLYSTARSQALKELYRSKELNLQRPQSIEADFEEVAASCGYFSSSLQTFAKEMLNFMQIFEELKEESENPLRSWNWLKFWRKSRTNQKPINEEEQLLLPKKSETRISRKNPELKLKSLDKRMAREEPNIKRTLGYRIISITRFISRDDIRFAIKVGTGASIYALLAYLPATKLYYQQWRGEWGLLSYMLVCSTTIGASNTVGYSRFIGTFIGAVVAIIVWILCQGHTWALAFCGWLISLPCFYLIVAKDRGPFGRYIMLTYNLSCLYSYSLSIKVVDDGGDDDTIAPIISEIAIHRLIAVLTGVIWGMIITRMIWPVSARRKFQDGLSLLWLRMGLIWKRDPLVALLEGDSPKYYMNLREEFALHRYLVYLDDLRNAAASEFELRGPFATKEFGHIIDSTTKMLDSFHAMNVIIQSNLVVTEGEKILLQHTAEERAQLCSIISHLYQFLASSLKLEYPMNDPLPSISKVRDCLLAKIFQYRKDSADAGTKGKLVVKDEEFELLYAYILVTGQLAEEIGKLEKEITNLYGVMNEDSLRLK